MSDDNFLARWSRRKRASTAGPERPVADANAPKGVIPPSSAPPASQPSAETPPPPLPPVESLTPESDFTPFMRPEVDPDLRQRALRALFRDPGFDVVDAMNVYIDDYSKPDPIPAEWLGKLQQMARLGEYRPPEPGKSDRDTSPQDEAAPQKTPEEQQVAGLAETPPSNTSASCPTPPTLRES